MATIRLPSSSSIAGSRAPSTTSRLRGLVAVTPGANSETATVAAISGMRRGVADHDVGGHRVPEQRHPPVRPGQAAAIGDHRVERAQQLARAGRIVGDPALERDRIAAVAGEVEGQCEVAVACQRDREGLHQLLRARRSRAR